MTMQEHLDVLDMMERIRQNSREPFWYGTRVSENPHGEHRRIRDGFVFLGNDDYVFVPLCTLGAPQNMTRAFGVVLNEREHVAYLEVIEPTEGSDLGQRFPSARLCLQELRNIISATPCPLRSLKVGRQCVRSQYEITQQGVTWPQMVMQVERFLSQHITNYTNHLARCALGNRFGSMAYNRESMRNSIGRFMSRREPVNDQLTGRLSAILDAL